MKMRLKITATAIAMLSSASVWAEQEVDIRGYIGAEGRYFAEQSSDPAQTESQFSINAEPEFYWQWDRGDNALTFKPYLRIDSQDSERTHFDIRELSWLHVERDWELRLGISKVFWGVTETVHLVDIVNQTDSVESFDGEDKLGQPMVQLSLIQDWGVLDAFILPGFRERTFAGKEGRLRGPLVIDSENAQYESSDKSGHIDFAVNWRNTFDDLDLSLNAFHGTSREPMFVPQLTQVTQSDGSVAWVADALTPYYPQITQLGAVAQYIYQDWLWKLEAINRFGRQIDNYNALVGGFEYTYVGVFGSFTDLGIVAEYAWDERGESGTTATQNDVSIAARIVMNDISSTEVLAGFSQDLDYSQSRSLFIEGSTRIGDSTKLTLDMWLFASEDMQDLAYSFRNEDFVQLSVEWYY
ncbi:hypothetical protein [Catenovulum sediminis]|uniref:hypothetical protein n=1 Tax=Catenovulum sediminis TaxID=1740262 RepID=UPI00117FF42C|nr:hypothetical protein [Catenovulum sediminis]